MKNKFNIIRIPLILINILTTTYLIISINKLNIIPTKYYIVGLILLIIINVLVILSLLLKQMMFKVLGIILSVFIIAISAIGIKYINNTNEFLDNSFNNNVVEISTYNLIVLKKSKYTSIDDLENKKLGHLTNSKEALETLKEKIITENIEYEDIFDLYDDLINKKTDAILIEESYLDLIADERKDIEDKINVIYSFNQESIIEKTNNEDKNIVRPLNIYISGSDSRSNNIQNKSRSDVNMIVTINPNTNEILLTSIPRDYYVQVHGQTGLKDKLTHSGIYGLDVSTATIEDLFNIKIDYSIKIGFNAVVEVVDLVDGVDIYSDTAFKNSIVTVKKGMNHFNGKEALRYARERKVYAGGDRHRIQNQQQVLEAVFKKIISDKSLLLKYDELLNSLGNLYRTDIPKEVITAFVKEQLDNGDKWTFETQWVNGKSASLNTHTSPKYKRYVMIPNEDEVEAASQKIKNIISK